ncbi:MAG TPA: glycosyltransferase family 2 protein [Alphaproteobacteria bacterium]
MKSGASIAVTLRNAGAVIDSFVAYHLAIGFDQVFLFFDDENDPAFSRFSNNDSVTPIRHDQKLRQAWSKLPIWGLMGPYIDLEVMARQTLNASLAMELAERKGLKWLLHIDIDELFLPTQKTVKDHFAALNVGGDEVVRYLNFEGVPEREEIGNYFEEITLFKVSPQMRPPLSDAQSALLKRTPQLWPQFFNYYANGKASVRLGRGLQPQGVHTFARLRGETNVSVSSEGVILHYPSCGFEHFWVKYRTLGRFSDRFWDRPAFVANDAPMPLKPVPIVDCSGTYHLEARDVVATNDRENARAFYLKRTVMQDQTQTLELIRSGLLKRIPQPSEVVRRLHRPA